MNQVQRDNCRIEFRTIVELVRIIVNLSSKHLNQFASSLVVDSVIILDCIVKLANIVCFLDFQETCPPTMLNM